jgi:hypothetical protein
MVAPADFGSIAAKARRSSSMQGESVALTEVDLVEILDSAA